MTPDSLVGRWCALGPSDRAFDPDDRAFDIHRIVDDHHDVAGCVSLDDVRRCRDADALDRAVILSGRLRSAWGRPLLTRPPRDLGRGHFASLQIEAHNQRHRLAIGRLDGPRARGPRFDARRIPDARLLALLQRPIDPTRREALEAERRRRGL